MCISDVFLPAGPCLHHVNYMAA